MILLNKKNHVRTSCFQMCRSFSVHTTKPQKKFEHMKNLDQKELLETNGGSLDIPWWQIVSDVINGTFTIWL